jgi:dipeptide/tripeptide permease
MNRQAAPAVPSAENSTDQVVAAKAAVPTSHPLGFYFFFWGEFAERCSYYGMRAILFLYLTEIMLFNDAKATEVLSYFKAACYLLPLLGGWLADRYFGKYWTIVGFSVPYVAGHFILGIQSNTAMIIALALLAGGSGVIKPNISTLLGLTYDQKRPGQHALRSSGFLLFYCAINIGAVISQKYLPVIREYVSDTYHNRHLAYQVAFQFPAWLMVISLAIFAAGKRFYAVEPKVAPKALTPEERKQRFQVLATLFGIFAIMVLFWVPYEQNDNLWTAFAREHVNLNLNMGFGMQKYAPDGFQWVNPLCVVLMAPLFGWVFRKIDPSARRITATRKILVGFLFTAAATGVLAAASFQAKATIVTEPAAKKTDAKAADAAAAQAEDKKAVVADTTLV